MSTEEDKCTVHHYEDSAERAVYRAKMTEVVLDIKSLFNLEIGNMCDNCLRNLLTLNIVLLKLFGFYKKCYFKFTLIERSDN